MDECKEFVVNGCEMKMGTVLKFHREYWVVMMRGSGCVTSRLPRGGDGCAGTEVGTPALHEQHY